MPGFGVSQFIYMICQLCQRERRTCSWCAHDVHIYPNSWEFTVFIHTICPGVSVVTRCPPLCSSFGVVFQCWKQSNKVILHDWFEFCVTQIKKSARLILLYGFRTASLNNWKILFFRHTGWMWGKNYKSSEQKAPHSRRGGRAWDQPETERQVKMSPS